MLRGLFSATQCSNSRKKLRNFGTEGIKIYQDFIAKWLVATIEDLGIFLINFWPLCNTANRFLAFAKETNLFSSKTLVCYSPNFVHLKRAKSIIKMDANFLFEYLLQSQSIILTERLKNRQLEVHRLIFTYTYGACPALLYQIPVAVTRDFWFI